jgi:RimJ/RimL family protein N-acetyltransferase
MTHHLSTLRLILREWRDSDLAPYAALNADPEVRKHFAALLTTAESNDEAARIRQHFADHGFGFFAVGVPSVSDFIGFNGIACGSFDLPGRGTDWHEIGWRYARAHWGHGYAIEGAQAVVDHAFRELHLAEVIAITTPANRRSRKVMERLGMTHDPADDFDHPNLPEGHPARPHVLYRMTANRYAALHTSA